jgi:hypothetical protein
MYATLRQREGVENAAEVIKEVAVSFLPGQKNIPGFVSDCFVGVGESCGRKISLSVFTSKEGAVESNRLEVACMGGAGVVSSAMERLNQPRMRWSANLPMVPPVNRPRVSGCLACRSAGGGGWGRMPVAERVSLNHPL